MSHERRRKQIVRCLFWAGLAIKGLDGLLEVLAGSVLPLVSVGVLRRFVMAITAPEISEDPEDLLANALRRGAEHFSNGSKLFSTLYLIAHGLIKIGLVVALLRDKRWAFPLALWFLGTFIVYQSYRIVCDYSFGMLTVTILDVGVFVLVWMEYRRKRPCSRFPR